MADSNYWSRFAGRRLSRRTLVARGAVLGSGMAGIALVGCSSSNNNNKAPATAAASAAAATRAATSAPAAAGSATAAATRAATAAAAASGSPRPAGSPAAAAAGAPSGLYGKPSGKVQKLEAPKTKGGTLRQFSYNALPSDSYDPHQTTFGPMSDVHSMVFSRIIAYDDPVEQALAPDLAVAIPEQPDKLTYLIKVNPAAKWQTKVGIAPDNPVAGQPVTAADIKYSIERQINPKSPKAGAFYRALDWANIDKIEQPDNLTLKITTKAPTAPFLNYMAGEFAFIVSQKIVDAAKDEITGPDKLVGSGPFTLEKFEALKEVRVARNPDWFLKDAGIAPGRPFLDGISQTFQPQEDNSIEGAFKSKQIDGTGWNDQTNADRVSKAVAGTTVYRTPIVGSIVSGFGVNYGPFKDERLRQALAIAWDRNALGQATAQGFFQFSGPVGWPITRWALPQEELLKRPGYRYQNQADRDADIKAAKQLFDAAGGQGAFPSSTVISYSNTPSYIAAYFPQLQKNLKDTLGLSLNGFLDETGYTKLVPLLLQHKVDYYFAYDNGGIDLDDWVKGNRSDSPYNFFQVQDPAVDALLDKQKAEFDFPARVKFGYDIQRLILDKGYPTVRALNNVNLTTGWNYVHSNFFPPWFGYSHLAANIWIDSTDPGYQGRPS